jgi:hypothetical protein
MFSSLVLVSFERCHCLEYVVLNGELEPAYPGIFLAEVSSPTNTLGWDNRCSGRDSKRTPSEYRPRALALRQPAR